jgi:Domain of unknown function (DUF2017)
LASIRRHRGRVEVQLDGDEREALLDIIDALTPHLGTVARTAPRAYDDAEMEEEYARLMRPEIEATRDADIDSMRDWLRAAPGDRRDLDESQALSWTRALNHLRLAAGGLLGVEEDGWDDQADDTLLQRREFTMLMALGWMQERLVAALDA